MDSRIIQYYQLNALRSPKNKAPALINTIAKKAVNIVMTKEHTTLMFNELNGTYYVKETIVGGRKPSKRIITVY